MNILIDVGHPAHVHIFRNLAKEMETKGHVVLFTCREKESCLDLLRAYKLPYKSFGKPFKTSLGKLVGLVIFNFKMFIVLLRFRADITLGHSSMYAAQMSWLLGIPHISVEDTGNMEQIRLYRPFTKSILVPDSFHKKLGKKQLKYAGNHELAYLHPKRFTPDPKILKDLNISNEESYMIIRLVGWNASHDFGHNGFSKENKIKAVNSFMKFSKVFISSEELLPPELLKYKLNLPPEKIHEVIAFSSLLFGESATMASEAAILGVPAIFCNNTFIPYTHEEEEKYKLVFNFTESKEDQEKAIIKGIELLSTPGIREEWHKRRDKMINEKIDVTAFLVWFVENWPESFKIMKENPDYQERFKVQSK